MNFSNKYITLKTLKDFILTIILIVFLVESSQSLSQCIYWLNIGYDEMIGSIIENIIRIVFFSILIILSIVDIFYIFIKRRGYRSFKEYYINLDSKLTKKNIEKKKVKIEKIQENISKLETQLSKLNEEEQSDTTKSSGEV